MTQIIHNRQSREEVATLLSAIGSSTARMELGEARRLFHGRGRCVPTLDFMTVDWYAPVALVILYRECDGEWLGSLADGLRELLGEALECVLVQRRYLKDSPTEAIIGEIPAQHQAWEAGLSYRLRLGQAQNVGFFPDMAVGRALVGRLAEGKRVLNLFAYTCAFSVAALRGGASHVVNLDMNRGALATGRENHRDNGLDLRRASFLAHDLFKSFGKLKKLGPYDLVIIDPPTDQGASFKAERDWPKVVKKLSTLLAPGAEIIACLNAPHLPAAFLTALFGAILPEARHIETLGAGEGFPEMDPERGLKIVRFKMGEPK